MYEIKIKTGFSAAHNLKNYKGKCEHLHGHNRVVEAIFEYKKLGKDGLAIDFRDAKVVVNKALESLDHSYLNDSALLKGENPTSENIARLIYEHVNKQSRAIRSIAVWENESSCATYTERSIEK